MFYRFEMHCGDDNDNSIYETVLEAKSKEDAFSQIEKKLLEKAKIHGIDLEIDGDDESLTSMYWEYYDEDGNDITDSDDIPDDSYGRPFHTDFYLVGIYSNEDDAWNDKAIYHGTW